MKTFRSAGPLATLLLGIGVATMHGGAMAQAYPSKPIRMVVPFTPGGTTDMPGRSIGRKIAAGVRHVVRGTGPKTLGGA